MAGLGADSKLPGHKGKAFAHFQQKRLEVGDDGLFKTGFLQGRIFGQVKKFQHVRIFDKFPFIGCRFRKIRNCSAVFIRRGKQALIIAGVDISLQLANAPVFGLAFREVTEARFFVVAPYNQADMGPAQLATQCVAFFIPGKGQVKLPEILKVRHQKPLPNSDCSSLERFLISSFPCCSSSTMRLPIIQ